jgi:hypothetical protein
MTALGDLIVRAMRDRTFAELAKGTAFTPSRWRQLASDPIPYELTDEVIAELAAACDVEEHRVAVAMYRDLYGGDPGAGRRRIARRERLAPHAGELTLLRLAREYGAPVGEMPNLEVITKVAATTRLPRAQIATAIHRALGVELQEMVEHPEDGPVAQPRSIDADTSAAEAKLADLRRQITDATDKEQP